MNEAITLEDVVKMTTEGYRVLGGVSFSVSKGDRVTITGMPGSGKTTLMGLIAGMDRPSAGQIYVMGKPVHLMDAEQTAAFRNLHIGTLQRTPAFLDSLTVLENVALPLTFRGMNAAKSCQAAKEQLKTFGLVYAANAHPSQLSPLEKQKASIARALIAQPQIFLISEIAAGLTSKDAEQIQGILEALRQYGEYTIIEFTGAPHGLLYSDKVLTLDHGRIQEVLQQ